jgi:hypothetical protein
MDAKTGTLSPADQLARDNPIRMPNESADYRSARHALLAEEFELRRHIERRGMQGCDTYSTRFNQREIAALNNIVAAVRYSDAKSARCWAI